MSSDGQFFLTTPIYYATGDPHIGHAYTTMLADVLARFQRQDGRDVLFLTGTDEHGQKIQEEADKRGVTPLELCDQMAETFEAAWDRLSISHDRFIRTTEEEHKAVVRAFLSRLWEQGDIYEGVYSGWYCVSDERYWTEKDLGEDRRCPICQKPVTHVEEKNYFFKMGAYQDRLIAQIEENPDWIVPDVRRNEILGFLRQPLGDLSISRPKSRVPWGISLPFDDEHVAYVWFDALINYLTASGAIDGEAEVGAQGFEDVTGSWWPCDLHIVGKDIITTHAVYWPTMLMAAGLPLYRQILAHGWWVVGEGAKMGKSAGNVVDPLALSDEFGTDAVRWYLLREMPTGSDATYTPERFMTRYEELANVLGNLASRAISMIAKYRDSVVPDVVGSGLDDEIARTLDQVRDDVAGLRIHDALGAAMDLARTANGFVEDQQPWTQAKAGDDAALDETLATLARSLVVLCALFQPVAPSKMEELARRLGLKGVPTLADAPNLGIGGVNVEKGDPLFPRVERG